MLGDSFFTFTGNLERAIKVGKIFVPMLGDSFFTGKSLHSSNQSGLIFVPMLGDSFFTAGLGCPTGWALYGPFAAGISN